MRKKQQEVLRVEISTDNVLKSRLIKSSKKRGCSVTSFVNSLVRSYYSNLQDMSDTTFLKEYVKRNVHRYEKVNMRFYDSDLANSIIMESKRKNISKSFTLYLIILNYYANK